MTLSRALMAICLLSATSAMPLARADEEPLEFMLTTLTSVGGGDYGEEVRPSDDSLPPETLSPPPLAPTPLPRVNYPVGAEWFAAQEGLASGPLTADEILKTHGQDLGKLKLWRPGMRDWVSAQELDWTSGGAQPPAMIDPIFVKALPPPAPEGADAAAIWFVRDAAESPWYGPVTQEALEDRMAEWDTYGAGPEAWRADAPYWHVTDFSKRHQPLPYAPERPLQPHTPLVGPGQLNDPDGAERLASRLAGYWIAFGPSRNGYTRDVLQVMLDPRGIISVRPGIATVDGAPDAGNDWQAASFAIQPLGESVALLTITAGYSGYPYGQPYVLRLTLVDDETLRDDGSGLLLKRAVPLPP